MSKRGGKFNNFKAKVARKRAGKDEAAGGVMEYITVQRLASHVEGRYQKYVRIGALTMVPLACETTLSNIKEACKRYFKCEDMDCDIVAGERGPSWTETCQISNFKTIRVRFIEYSSSRLAHLYGLPKTHKEQLAVRPILSATSTYNYALAKWLEEKLKPLSYNKYSILDVFKFAEEIRTEVINEADILVSYDVTSLFTNVPLDETIGILVEKAFNNNWFNSEYNLDISRQDLTVLLNIATKDQLFQFEGTLFEQFDGVAMGSPLGPLMANVFMCSIEEQLEHNGKMPPLYRRYVDDTLTVMPGINAASAFLNVLNEIHPSISFTMEIEKDGMLPFIGIQLINNSRSIDTKVFIKPTNKGLLLHYNSHVDVRYKHCLLQTMLERAYQLSSSWEFFTEECTRLEKVFTKLRYPTNDINRIINRFVLDKTASTKLPTLDSTTMVIARVPLPFKDQKSADSVKRQLKELGSKIRINFQPVFVSKKLEDEIKITEKKPSLVNQQRVVYQFKCSFCDENYVGFTMRHLHERCDEHKLNSSSIKKHFINKHDCLPDNFNDQFKVLRKCKTKYDCLVYEMLYIRDLSPSLNIQGDSIRAKLFT
ncbi:uncharacterized protein LOC110242811 [Exaiptasia diaphana]|uniref:Reverse transcriptase domain-containing protein n=1 Tax=Exaiptasia diaphana TaxID=2652724 RepID=A0A913XHT2_EXADI|nr:uncharacterized protein LOC110242811 [Exaiptasia diaphana]